MKARIRLTLSLILATIVAGAGSALAQDTRADAIRQQQSDWQQQLSRSQPMRRGSFTNARQH